MRLLRKLYGRYNLSKYGRLWEVMGPVWFGAHRIPGEMNIRKNKSRLVA